MLYLVATPIGNLEDITFRAVRVLREVSLIAAEDTRHSGRLLKHYEIETPMMSYHDFSSTHRVQQIVDRLHAGDVALITDAGMPGVSDPGYRLVQAAIEAGIEVTAIPGPSASIAALVASGLPTDRFFFQGFLPKQSKARQAALLEVATWTATLIYYESPHRLHSMLADAAAVLGANRPVVVARELTKLHEEMWRGSLAEAAAYYESQRARGEITVVIGGAIQEDRQWEENEVRQALEALLAEGALTRKQAAAQIAALSGWRKRDIYQLSLSDRE